MDIEILKDILNLAEDKQNTIVYFINHDIQKKLLNFYFYDKNNCLWIDSITLIQPDSFFFNLNIYPDTCNNINTSGQTHPQTGSCTCLDGKLPVDGKNCYSEPDLDVLISFASTNSELSDEYTDVISMGDQSWAGG